MSRLAAVLAMLLITTMADTRTTAAAGREWLVQVGTGAQSSNSPQLQGAFATVAALTPVRPWLLVGGEAAWYEMRAGTYARPIEEFVRSDAGYEHSRAVTGAVTGRFQFPVRGVSPFLLAELGIGGIDFGDGWWTISGSPPTSGTIPGESSLMGIAGVGVGLRLTTARPWPDAEASARTAAWTSTHPVFQNGASTAQLSSLRVALTW